LLLQIRDRIHEHLSPLPQENGPKLLIKEAYLVGGRPPPTTTGYALGWHAIDGGQAHDYIWGGLDCQKLWERKVRMDAQAISSKRVHFTGA